MDKTDTIHLVTASDGNTLTGVVAQIASATCNLIGTGYKLFAHIIGHDISDAMASDLRGALDPLGAGLHVEILSTRHAPPAHLPPARPDLPLSSWCRLLIPDLLPELGRAIYADCDTIVYTSLVPLWEMITPDKVLLAVRDGTLGETLDTRRLPGLDPRKPRFNAGVLGMNLAAIRERGDMAKCLALAANRSLTFPRAAPDLLNAAFHDSVHLVSERWNTLTKLSEHRVSLVPGHPCILHTEWKAKPWHFQRKGSHGVVKLFYDYLALTDWPEHHRPRPRFRQTAPLWRIGLERARLHLGATRGRLQTAG